MPAQVKISLSTEDKNPLEKHVKSRKTPVRLLKRSRIILLAAESIPNYKIAEKLAIDVNKVGRWRHRFFESGQETHNKNKNHLYGLNLLKQFW